MGVGCFGYAAGGCEGVEFGLLGGFGRHCCCGGVGVGGLCERVLVLWERVSRGTTVSEEVYMQDG